MHLHTTGVEFMNGYCVGSVLIKRWRGVLLSESAVVALPRVLSSFMLSCCDPVLPGAVNVEEQLC